MVKNSFFVFFVVFFLSSLFWNANFVLAQENIEINFFSSQTCPHCAAEREFLVELEEKYPEIKVNEYEVVFHPENKTFLEEFYKNYNVPEKDQGWVPVTFTSTKYFIGFNDQVAQEIETCLEECLGGETKPFQEIKIPFLGSVDITSVSLPVLTVIFGALDGFDPCAMWVLLFLIVLLINTRSRKRMWLIGGTFIAASSLVYYLILTAWFNLFLVISYVNLTRLLIGALAILVGLWQIKSFLMFQPGVCKVLDGKPGFQDRIKERLRIQSEKLVASPLTFAIFGGVILLALGVNLVEFFCSSGLPAIYTRILASQNLNAFSYYLYLLLYTFVFILDDLIIFSLAVVTMSKFGFTEKYNYWATLIGGLLLIVLGLLLLFKPELLMFV